jgi:hypothetical protein
MIFQHPQLLGLLAVRADGGGVHLDGLHHYSLDFSGL